MQGNTLLMQDLGKKIISVKDSPAAIFLGVVLLAIIGLVIAAILVLNPSENTKKPVVMSSAVQEVDGEQIISVSAKGGFSPSIVSASANKNTILKVSTKDTYDCSNTLLIPSLRKQILLPPSGTAEIEIPAQSPGTSIHATCSMGMYNLELNFN